MVWFVYGSHLQMGPMYHIPGHGIAFLLQKRACVPMFQLPALVWGLSGRHVGLQTITHETTKMKTAPVVGTLAPDSQWVAPVLSIYD